MKRKRRKTNVFLSFILDILIITAAVAAGLFGVSLLRVDTSEIKARAAEEITKAEGKGNISELPALTTLDLLYGYNTETGEVEYMAIEILDCIAGELIMVKIPVEISYTMSSQLYRELAETNIELPQTVTFSELYRYYHDERAFEAGCRMLSELISFNILSYTAVPLEDFCLLYEPEDRSYEETALRYAVTEEQVKNWSPESCGSVKAFLEKLLADAVTNRTVAERLRYLDVYDNLNEERVISTVAPVISGNERSEADTAALSAMLYHYVY